MENLKGQIDDLRKQINEQTSSLRTEISDMSRDISSLKHRVDDSVFAKNPDSAIGSRYAPRSGDVIGHAVLFGDGDPSDAETFEELYGLSIDEVMRFYCKNDHEDGGLFNVVNAHAAWLIHIGRTLPPELEAAFQVFLLALRTHWPQRPTQERGSPLEVAYRNFWTVHDKAKPEAEKAQKRNEKVLIFESMAATVRTKRNAPPQPEA